jgi:aryl-alcohol dehydrogenase-like predicted oxidoreductase/predicted kinase
VAGKSHEAVKDPEHWLGGAELRIGLGCMRLSTDEDAHEERALATIAAALDAGITVFDTARAYGKNEALLARALRGRTARIVTKGGMSRESGRWIPDGRAKSIRAHCEASLDALDGLPIDLYLVHAPDPRTPWRTTVRALARLVDDGLVRRVGLSNVNRAQLDDAIELAPVAAVQVALSMLDDRALRGGVLERCEQLGIALIAHSPLGGPRRAGALGRRPELVEAAAGTGATPAEVALAWLLALSPVVLPIPGARRPESARSAACATALELDEDVRASLNMAFGFTRPAPLARAPLTGPPHPPHVPPGALPCPSSHGSEDPVARGSRFRAGFRTGASRPTTGGEVVLVMGIPGAGKSRVAEEHVAHGYLRLNRDERGGSLRELAAALDEALAAGERRVVLDNTYLTRASRSHVVEAAARYGVTARCVWLDTPLAQAQVNLVERLLDRFGALPTPDALRESARAEPGLLAPTSQMRALRELEPPADDEGFAEIERVEFERAPREGRAGVFVAAAALGQPGWEEAIRSAEPDTPLLLFDWAESAGHLRDLAAKLAAAASGPVETAACPHGGGPPTCWCRPPLPGLPLAFARTHGVDPARSLLVGTSPAHRTLATTLGARHVGL